MVAQRDNGTNDSKLVHMHFATGQVLVGTTVPGSGQAAAGAKLLLRRGTELPPADAVPPWDGPFAASAQALLSDYAAFVSDQRARYCQ